MKNQHYEEEMKQLSIKQSKKYWDRFSKEKSNKEQIDEPKELEPVYKDQFNKLIKQYLKENLSIYVEQNYYGSGWKITLYIEDEKLNF